LRRRSDRIQALAAAVAALMVLALIPAALVVGRLTWQHFSAVSQEQAASRHLVTATVVGATFEATASRTELAELTWTYPDQVEHSGRLAVTQVDAPGATIPIWVDDTGAMSPAPLNGTNVWIDTVALALVVLVLGTLIAFCGYRVVRRLLDRRRARSLAQEWLRFNQSRSGGFRDTPG